MSLNLPLASHPVTPAPGTPAPWNHRNAYPAPRTPYPALWYPYPGTPSTWEPPHPVPRTPQPAARTPHPAPRTPYPYPHPAPRTPHPAPRTPHPAPRTPHPAPRTPQPRTPPHYATLPTNHAIVHLFAVEKDILSGIPANMQELLSFHSLIVYSREKCCTLAEFFIWRCERDKILHFCTFILWIRASSSQNVPRTEPKVAPRTRLEIRAQSRLLLPIGSQTEPKVAISRTRLENQAQMR